MALRAAVGLVCGFLLAPPAWAATRLYFPATTGADASPGYDSGWTDTTEAGRYKLEDSKGTSAITVGTQIGPMAGTAGHQWLDRQYVSDPLAGAQTVSGTVKLQLMTREYAATDNVDQLILVLKVVSNNGSAVRGTLLARGNYATTAEFVNNATHRNKTGADGDTVTSVNALDGDRIVVEIGYSNSGSGTSPEGSAKYGENATDLPENETQTTDGAGWLEFSATLTFQAPVAARRVTVIE